MSEAFFVLSGTMTYTFGAASEREVRAPAGTVVVVPADVPHAFRNDDADDVVFLNVHTPDRGFARSLRGQRDRLDIPFDQHDPPATGSRPAGEAIVVGAGHGEPGPGVDTLVRYVGEDLVVTEEPDRVTIAIPAAPGPDVVFVSG